jgi:hypothetical protein
LGQNAANISQWVPFSNGYSDPSNSIAQNDEIMSDDQIQADIINSFFTDAISHKTRPSFSSVISNTLPPSNIFSWQDVANKIGGEIPGELTKSRGHNTCATRVSYALNYSGSLIESFSQSFTGADNKNYVMGALTMLTYLTKSYDTLPVNTIHLKNSISLQLTESYIRDQLRGKQGIYVLIPIDGSTTTGWGASGHVDILRSDGSFASGHSYYSATGGVREIYLFILN